MHIKVDVVLNQNECIYYEKFLRYIARLFPSFKVM